MTNTQIVNKIKKHYKANGISLSIRSQKNLIIIDNCFMNSASQIIESITGIKTKSIGNSIAKIL